MCLSSQAIDQRPIVLWRQLKHSQWSFCWQWHRGPSVQSSLRIITQHPSNCRKHFYHSQPVSSTNYRYIWYIVLASVSSDVHRCENVTQHHADDDARCSLRLKFTLSVQWCLSVFASLSSDRRYISILHQDDRAASSIRLWDSWNSSSTLHHENSCKVIIYS